MAGNIYFTSAESYRPGAVPGYSLTGYGAAGAGKSSAMRFAFKTGASGATSVSFDISRFAGRTGDPSFVFLITDSAAGYENADASQVTKTGDVSAEYSDFWHLSGSASVNLLPNKDYYLWLIPAAVYGYFNCANVTDLSGSPYITVDGSYGGIVYIDSGAGFEEYQCFIDSGTAFELYQPCVDNGTAWEDY